jgi:Flp pilus assembly protein TadD
MTTTAFERLSAALSDRYRLEREVGAGGMATVYLSPRTSATTAFQKSIAIAGRGPNRLASLGHVLAVSGRKAEAEEVLKELAKKGQSGPIQPYMVALVLVGLGRKDEAITMLEQAYRERSALLSYLDRDPRFDSLRTESRFTGLLRRMNFAPSPDTPGRRS